MPGSVFDLFEQAAGEVPENDFLVVPPSAARAYAPGGVTLRYGEASRLIRALGDRYASAGYGHGHRVALLLENRPDFILHWLALNALGAGVVPVNPFYRARELAYLLDHSEAALAVVLQDRIGDVEGASGTVPVISPDSQSIPAPASPPLPGGPGPATECGLLYTSGTTGDPKGCILSNAYYEAMGRWYVGLGGLCAVEPGRERLLTPLPLFHMNAMACSFVAMVLARGCLILLDRFHPSTWWADVAATGATVVHYLGVMPAILLARQPEPAERAHRVRFGFGANVEPAHQQAFHDRFGFPLIEGWAMTETGGGGAIADNTERRRPGTRCIGWPVACEARIVDEDDNDLPAGEPGNLIVRHRGPDPRAGFFSGYHKDPAATEAAWRGGWFRTGDIAWRADDGALHFVDRAKNVIRRSGENISALEVETVLLRHAAVAGVAVIAVPDELRGEEVMACVVPAAGARPDEAAARSLIAWCLDRLAYYKAPGWVLFLDALPVTATNKIRKTTIREMGGDPRARPGCFDLRALKRATNAPAR